MSQGSIERKRKAESGEIEDVENDANSDQNMSRPVKVPRLINDADELLRDFDLAHNTIASQLASLEGAKAALHTKLLTISEVVEEFAAIPLTPTKMVTTSINIGVKIYEHHNLCSLGSSIHSSKGIDLLRCVLHPTWQQFMPRDKEGRIYLDINLDWIDDLLDDLLDEEGVEAALPTSLWKETSVAGFRDLNANGKLGYQLVRTFFQQRLVGDHVPDLIAEQMKLRFSQEVGKAFRRTLGSVKAYQCPDAWPYPQEYIDRYIVGCDLITIDSLLSFEIIISLMDSIETPCYIVYVEKINRAINAVITHRIALVHGKPVRNRNEIFLNTLAIYMLGEDIANRPPLLLRSLGSSAFKIVMGPNENEPLIKVSCKHYLRAVARDDTFCIKIVPVYPTIFGVPDRNYETQITKAISRSILKESEVARDDNDAPRVYNPYAGNPEGEVWGKSYHSFKAVKEKWAVNIDIKEYKLYVYSGFMKHFLYACYNIFTDASKPDTGNNVSNCEGNICDDADSSSVSSNKPDLLLAIQENFADIKKHCNPSFSSFQNSNGISNSNSSSSSSSSENDNLCLTHPIVYLNVSGEKMSVLRASILRCEPLQDSQLAVRVSGRWQEQEGDVDEEGYIRYDLPKRSFKSLISYIRAYALKPALSKLFIRKEDGEDLAATLNYLAIPKESIPIQLT